MIFADTGGLMGDRLTILITNAGLSAYAGSEVVVRDLACGLMARGHRPIVYSPTLGPIGEEIRSRGIVVIDELRNLAETPDLIHAHHAVPCGEALIRFPDIPAVFMCHGFSSWIEEPVHFPQIGVYVAVDEACRDRLVQSCAIDPARVVIMRNAVDLARIPQRPTPLNSAPVRALAFGKASAVPEIRAACGELDIELQAIGYPADQPNPHPEKELVKFDIVFATARAALEALCAGCAVIVCDARGMAGLVTSDNFDFLWNRNLGLRSLGASISVAALVDEIRRYDPEDAARVSRHTREAANLSQRLDEFEKLYHDVLGGARRPQITPAAHEAAVARFIHDYLPRQPWDKRWPWLAERDELGNQISALEARLMTAADMVSKLRNALAEERHQRKIRDDELSARTNECQRLRHQLHQLEAQLALSRGQAGASERVAASTDDR